MEYKRLIIEMLDDVHESDIVFLRRIYILIKRHIERMKACTNTGETQK